MPAFWKLRQKHLEIKASPGYIATLCQEIKEGKKEGRKEGRKEGKVKK
jgi:hypothetical protein